jgi:hypothetical protein
MIFRTLNSFIGCPAAIGPTISIEGGWRVLLSSQFRLLGNLIPLHGVKLLNVERPPVRGSRLR